MKLYPIPGGTWAGTEAGWKKALTAAGLDHKKFRAADGKPVTREVPTAKSELIEFLNFFAVDVYRTGDAANIVVGVDPEELQRRHNPDAPDLVPGSAAAALAQPGPDDGINFQPGPVVQEVTDIDVVFGALHVNTQLRLAVVGIDNAMAALRDKQQA